jgi:hypothetical protein
MSHLAATGEVSDETGMASTLLAREVGYPGTSIAFAQLLSGMERSGLIRREVRGKRTYRIMAAPGSAARLLSAGERKPVSRTATAAGVDYDELARRLLVQVVRELAAGRRELGWPPGPPQDSAGSAGDGLQAVLSGSQQPVPGDASPPLPVRILDGALAAQPADVAALTGGENPPGGPHGATGGPTEPGGPANGAGQPGDAAGEAVEPDPTLEGALADLQRELASARAQQNRVTAENARLREQLRTARRTLARLRGRAARKPVTEDLDADEAGLLDRLLSPTAKPDSEVPSPH